VIKGWFYALVKLVSWIVLRVGFGLEVHGQEHVPRHGTFILASNHLSFLDPLVLGVACPRRVCFMARDTLFRHPLLRVFLHGVRVIPLKRDESDVTAVREALKRLRAGEPIALFPEGTRQLSGRLGRAKRGVGLIALKAQVPIVPALVTGTFAALPPRSPRLHRTKIRVAFGPPISYTSSSLSSSRDRQTELAEFLTQQWHRLEGARTT